MRSGKLRHSVIIKKQTDERNKYNQKSGKLVKVFKAKANVKVLSGSELVKAGVELTREYLSVLMRFDSRLQYEHKLEYNNHVYDVESIKPNDKNRDMIVTVARSVN